MMFHSWHCKLRGPSAAPELSPPFPIVPGGKIVPVPWECLSTLPCPFPNPINPPGTAKIGRKIRLFIINNNIICYKELFCSEMCFSTQLGSLCSSWAPPEPQKFLRIPPAPPNPRMGLQTQDSSSSRAPELINLLFLAQSVTAQATQGI